MLSSFHILLKRFLSGFSLLGSSPLPHSHISISLLVLKFVLEIDVRTHHPSIFPILCSVVYFLFHFYELYDLRFYWCDFYLYFHWLMIRHKGLQLSYFEGSYYVMSISRFGYEAIDLIASLQAWIPPRPSLLLKKERFHPT